MIPIDNLTCEAETAIEEFEGRMKDVLPPGYCQDRSIFYRFLKARDFDVDKAEKMLRKNIQWRKAFQVDTIVEDFKPKEIFCKYLYPTVFGKDKKGDLVVYCPFGKIDSKDMFRGIKFTQLMMHITWFEEKCMASAMKQTGRDSTQVILILDFNELTFSNGTSKSSREFMLGLIHLCQENYPERLKTVVAINAPAYCSILYSILKTVISSWMLSKISVFGQNGWKEYLLELMDADILPEFMGGTRTDPDGNPMCNTFMVHGGKISPKYYLSDEQRYFEDRSQVETIFIPSLEKKEIYIDVTENESQIHWRFLVKGKDIKFGLALEISDENEEELLPVEKYSTSDGTEEGFYKCQQIGKYIIIFDNSYSWMSSKEVEYCVTIKTTYDKLQTRTAH